MLIFFNLVFFIGGRSMVRIIGSGTEGLKKFIEKCRKAGGTPIFRTKYSGKRLPGNAVIVACYGKGREVPGGTIVNVPEELIAEMEKRVGDWKWLAERLGIPVS